MTDFQQKVYDMFKWFHTFCVENDVKYYAIAGTALGAVRHSGFIPWDDDIDVGLPRKEYEKLISLMDGKQFGDYVLEKPLQYKDSIYGFAKIYDTSTTLIEGSRYDSKRGVYIDVFPLDGAGNDYAEALQRFRSILKTRRWVYNKVCKLRKKRGLKKNLASLIVRAIPFTSWRKLNIVVDNKAKELEYDTSEYVANYYGAWGAEREMCKREVYGTPKLYKFEDGEMYLPEDADKYLTTMYGDYMTPPPVEKRVSHHGFIYCSLTESYLKNKK